MHRHEGNAKPAGFIVPSPTAFSGQTGSGNFKYGRNRLIELAAIYFLFDLSTMYGSIGRCLDAYFRF